MGEEKEGRKKFDQVVKHLSQSSVKLTKYAKGYGWEIKIYTDNFDDVYSKIKEVDGNLRKEYGALE